MRPSADPLYHPVGRIPRRRPGADASILTAQTYPSPRSRSCDGASIGSPAELLGDAAGLCLLRAGDVLDPDAWRSSRRASARRTSPTPTRSIWTDRLASSRLESGSRPGTGYVGRVALFSRALIERLPRAARPDMGAVEAFGILAAHACRRASIARAPSPGCLPPRRIPSAAASPRSGLRSGRRAGRGHGPEMAIARSGTPRQRHPSRDRIDLISVACRGVLEATDYPAIELVVVDNGSTDPAVLASTRSCSETAACGSCAILTISTSPPWSMPACRPLGQVVVLLNNDIGVKDAGWLREMVRQALRPEVGAVGAKLLFGDGTLQHVGVVVGLAGRAGPSPASSPGRYARHLGQLASRTRCRP